MDNLFHGKSQGYFSLKQYDQAIEWARRAIAVGQNNPRPRATLAAALALTGHEVESREALQQYLELPSSERFRTIAALKAYDAQFKISNPRALEAEGRFYDGLRKAGMPEE
jgi:tetratricopeptide (TPR) repeat protein